MGKTEKFAVLYSFKIHEGKAQVFIETWTALTNLIYQHEGSYGSRLHRIDQHTYLAYAQWPDKMRWQSAGALLPAHAEELRETLIACCSEIKTLYELEIVKDFLTDQLYADK